MYYCRVLEGRARPGQIEAVMQVLQDRLERVRKVSGFLFVQILQAADDFIAVSSWRTTKDLRAYAESELAQDLLRALTPLCISPPQVRTFDLRLMAESEEGFFPIDEGGEG
ncbi:MAG: antibiotic biosynthesis monooxygenase [Candidatus Binatia bacterium]|nr:antibiotic biosynthesis monooxygenase [Candidatus Binatia bacterium]